MSIRTYEIDDVRTLLDEMSDDDVVYLIKKPKTTEKARIVGKSNKVLPFKKTYEFADELTDENDAD